MGHIARTDAELVEASRRGEREAFGHLVARYQDVVCAVSYSSTGNWATSEDVAQETFLAAWRQLGELRDTVRLRSWLCSIARNLARKARRRTQREEPACEEPIAEANPFDATAQAEVDRIVREALTRIPETYRETLVLYYCESRSVREVAVTLGISEEAAMQRLTRGRRHLANGMTELVERALSRPRKSLVAAIVAALPFAVPSHASAAPTSGGSTMWKIAIASVLATTAGTTGYLVHRASSHDAHASPPAASAAVSPARVAAAPTAHAPVVMHAPMPGPAPHVPTALAPADDEEPAPKVVPETTLQQLAIEQGPSRGPANAPVTVVLYQDLMCSYCGQVLGTIDQLWDEYPNKLRLVVKQFPVHAQAHLAAEASLAADAQGKFWEMHDLMIAHQDDLSHDALIGYAQQAGLNVATFTTALDQHTYAQALATEIDAGKQIGVTATPEFLINGHDYRGAQPIEAFRAAIDAALAASN
jgi:RNA polymerase sigma factor (sigma-70 family)